MISNAYVSKQFSTASPQPAAGQGESTWVRPAVSIALLLAVAVPAAANGGYFPTSWGWMSLAFGWVALLALLLRRQVLLGPLEWATLASLVALTGWTAASAFWSASVTQTMLATERMLVYLLGTAAVLLVASRGRIPALLTGLTAGSGFVCAYALATRLFPERLGNVDDLALNRLARPVGYWNALGLLAVMGALLAWCLAARARTPLGRAASAAVLDVFLPTLYFTFSRGGWIALAVGLVAMLAFDRSRLELITTLLVVAPAPAVAVLLASRSHALTTNAPVLSAASHDGHRLAAVILVAAACSAGTVLLLRRAARQFRPSHSLRLAYIGALWLVVLVSAGAGIVRYGAPWRIASNAYDQFTTRIGTGSSGAGADLNSRLFSLAGNGRVQMWKAAWHDSRAHPWIGSGAGTFEEYWLQHRSISAKVRNAHSLYLETLAELGPPGLLVLVALLLIPLAALGRARGHPLVVGAVGAYVAYLVHAGSDWDWQIPAVTMTAFACAAVVLVAARNEKVVVPLARPGRALGVAVVLGAATLALVGLIGNSALSAAGSASDQERWQRAEAQARKASAWAPWSSEGWQLLGESQLQQAKFADARASFERGIAKDRRNWSLWFDLALASGGAAKRQAALEALRLDPLSPEIAQIRPSLGLAVKETPSVHA